MHAAFDRVRIDSAGQVKEHPMLNPMSEQEVDQSVDTDLEQPQTLSERAQGLVEYGLIIALVAVLAIAGLIVFGPAVSSLLSKLGGSV
jgi:hypothetical protein